MFGFLNSTILFAALAALIPLLIHLFFRRKVKIVEFSSLRHLKAMQRRQVRKLRLKQILLLIVRMLIILAVVLAFARPTSQQDTVGSHAAVSAAIIFDNSASMDRSVRDGNLFELARRRAQELTATFDQGDRVLLLPVAGQGRDDPGASFTSAAVSSQMLDELRVSYGAANLGAALGNAADMLGEATNLNKEIYLISDRQRFSLPDTALLQGAEVAVYAVDLPIEKNDNIGIITVDFGGQLIMPGHDFDIRATVRNYGDSDRDEIIASLFMGGSRVAQTDFSIDAGEDTELRFTRSVSTTGFHSGYVELSDDGFAADNRYYFSFKIPDRFNLLVIDGDGTGSLIALALSPSSDINQYWSVKQTDASGLAGVDFWDYDVVVLAGAPVLSDVYVHRLKAFINQGRAMLITYGPRTDIDDFNTVWSGVAGLVFDGPMKDSFTRAGYYSLGSFETDHPVFSVFDFESEQPPEVKFYTLPRTRPGPEAAVLARFTGDHPALVENEFGRGRVLTFTGPIAARYSDLATQAFFVPFVSRMAEYLAADLSSYDLQLSCGLNITRTLTPGRQIASFLNLTAPDSSQYALGPEDEKGGLIVRVPQAVTPGVYRIHHNGQEIDRFAVNVDRQECDLSAVDADQFADAIGAGDLNQLAAGTDMAAVIAEYRHGKELWQIFLWLAAALLVAEVLLSRGKDSEETS